MQTLLCFREGAMLPTSSNLDPNLITKSCADAGRTSEHEQTRSAKDGLCLGDQI